MKQRGKLEHQWTYKEDRELESIFQSMSDEELAQHFDLSKAQIVKRRSELKLRRKNAAELELEKRAQFVEENHKTMSIDDMAFELGISRTSLLALANKQLGLQLSKREEATRTKARTDYICSQYGRKTVEEIAKDIGMTRNSVSQIVCKLGLKQKLDKSIIDEYEATRLKPKLIAERLGLGETYVNHQIKKYKAEHGIKFSQTK